MAEESFRSKPYKVDGQGRICLPLEVREILGTAKGHYVQYVVEGKRVTVKKVRWLGE